MSATSSADIRKIESEVQSLQQRLREKMTKSQQSNNPESHEVYQMLNDFSTSLYSIVQWQKEHST